MALTTPILNSVTAFDATKPYTFSFNVVGGSKVYANRLTVIRADNSQIIYQETVYTTAYQHVLPGGTLDNGMKYVAWVQTLGSDYQIYSSASANISFTCVLTPGYEFTNIEENQTLNTQSYLFNVKYTSAELEVLSSYQFFLYQNGNVISESSVVYNSTIGAEIEFGYEFQGLENNKSYSIRCTGTTKRGMILDTGFIDFSVVAARVDNYDNLRLENQCELGRVKITTNFSLARGYVTNGNWSVPGRVGLTNYTNSSAIIDEGVSIPNEFTIRIWGYNDFIDGRSINNDKNNSNLTVSYTPSTRPTNTNERGIIRVFYREDTTQGICWVEVSAEINAVVHQTVLSNFLPRNSFSSNEIFIWIRLKDGLFDVKLENGIDLITFYILEESNAYKVQFYAVRNQRWEDWINSKYNQMLEKGFYETLKVDSDGYVRAYFADGTSSGHNFTDASYNMLWGTDRIVAGAEYILSE